MAQAIRQQHLDGLAAANAEALQVVDDFASSCIHKYWIDWVGSQPTGPICVFLVSVSPQLLQLRPDSNLETLRVGLGKSEK